MMIDLGCLMNEVLAKDMAEYAPRGVKLVPVAAGVRADGLIVDAGTHGAAVGSGRAHEREGMPVLVLGDDVAHTARMALARAGAKVYFRGRGGDHDLAFLLQGFSEFVREHRGLKLTAVLAAVPGSEALTPEQALRV